MEKTYGGYTVAELREFIAHSENTCESIDAVVGDDGASASIISDLLDALPSDAAQAPVEPVGEASSMPGTDGFTMAVFEAAKVPVGTKVYIAPVAPAASAPSKETIERLFIKHGGPVPNEGWCLNKSGLADFLRDLSAPLAAALTDEQRAHLETAARSAQFEGRSILEAGLRSILEAHGDKP